MSAVLIVSPDKYSDLLKAHDRAATTIDGQFNEGLWNAGVRQIFGDELTDQMIRSHDICVVVRYGQHGIPATHLHFPNTPSDAETAPGPPPPRVAPDRPQ